MVKYKEYATVESYLLKRYEELTRILRSAITKGEYEVIFHMRKEISETLLNCGILDDEELETYRQGIQAKIDMEQKGF